eukprot:c22014_g1_i1 orf=726-3524(-)
MLDSSKILAGKVLEASPNMEIKAKEQPETLDNLIKQTLTSDSFLSFTKAEKSPVQWFHLLDTLDQQNMNHDLSSSKLEMALDSTGCRQEEMVGYDSKAGESPATKSLSAKGGNLFGRGLQTSGDKFPSLKMVAIAQAAKDIPGWPLMSSKLTTHKCEKCSQEFSSPLNQRRHMQATHRRPLNGDKEDLKNKKEQIAIFWDKLTVEDACEIVSFKNLSLGDLSASSLVQALSTHLQQPGLLSLPQSYIKVAALLLDIVQSKSSRYPLNSEDLFTILEDASERNMLHGVTSSSMQRCIFGSEPGRVGLETRNLVSSLGFLVELRLVKAWMDDKDAEALRCQNALVEEEEAAQKKRAKLQERRRQKKMRQRESKDKDKKAVESLSGLQDLKLGFFSHKEEDSPTTTTSSSGGFSGADTSPIETPDGALLDTEGAAYSNVSSSCLADYQLRYPDYQEELELPNALLDQRGDNRKPLRQFRHPVEYGVVGGRGWKDRRHGDYTYLPSHLKYGLSNDRKGFEHQFGDQWLRKPYNTIGSSAQEFLKTSTFRCTQYREKFPVLKRPTSIAGSGHAVWTRKALQTSDVSQHDENGEPVGSEIVNDTLGALAGKLEVNIWPANLGKPEGLSRDSSLSFDSITSHSSSSLSARIGAEDQESHEGMTLSPQTTMGEGKLGSGELVIGSVTIPFGDPWSGNPSDAKSEKSEVKNLPNEEETVSVGELAPKEVPAGFSSAALSVEGVPPLLKSASMDTVRVSPLTWKDAPPYHPLSESSTTSKCHVPTLLNRPGVMKVWRPITERNDTFSASSTGIECAEDQEQDAAIMPIVCRKEGGSCTPLGVDKDLDDTSYTRHQDCEDEAAGIRHVFVPEKKFVQVEPPGQAGSNFSALKRDIASLLHRRWDDATSLADAVYHQELDETDTISLPSAKDNNSLHVNEASSL